MIINCNKGCHINGGTTTARLNVDSQEVICDICGDSVLGISDFAKECMRTTGNVLKEREVKSFVFNCLECGKDVKTVLVGESPSGLGCDGDCKINISEEMVNAIRHYGKDHE